jgi:hypothetical protein
VLTGFVPATVATVKSVACVCATLDGVAAPIPVGAVELSTVSAIVALPLRPCASAIDTGSDFEPGTVSSGIVAANV